jgi:NADPH2:quinone reductase
MRAAWYEANGAARDVLVVGSVGDPEPGRGQVLVKVSAAGVNPADVKYRSGTRGRTMRHPRIIPGDDGAGVIEAVGDGVAPARVGERVWVHSANQGQPHGTAAEFVVVPADRAITLPDHVPFTAGACLGVPALTAHRCLFADGPVDGATILVTGGAGAVGHYGVQLAKQAGATVIATASTTEKQRVAAEAGADHVVDYRDPSAAAAIFEITEGRGVDRVVDVAFGANLGLTTELLAVNGTIATYSSDAVPNPSVPFYPLMRKGATIRTVLVYVMPAPALRQAVDDISRLLSADALTHAIAVTRPLEEIATAHEDVEEGRLIGNAVITL